MAQMFDLLQEGHIRPIFPIKIFSFEDIPSAFRYMRSANHIGKIVISNSGNDEINVPVIISLFDYKKNADQRFLDSGCTTDTQP